MGERAIPVISEFHRRFSTPFMNRPEPIRDNVSRHDRTAALQSRLQEALVLEFHKDG